MKRHLPLASALVLSVALAACGGSETSQEVAADASATQTEPEAATPAVENDATTDANEALPAPTSTLSATSNSARSGADIFANHCSYCHAAGEEHPGTFQLAATRGADFAVLEQREDLSADYVKYIVRHGLNAMPPFKPTVITETELDALAAYLVKAD